MKKSIQKKNHYEQGSAKFLILHLKKIVMMYQCRYIKIACQYFNPKNQCECIYKYMYIDFLSSFASFSLFNYNHIYKINTQSPSLQTIHCTWCIWPLPTFTGDFSPLKTQSEQRFTAQQTLLQQVHPFICYIVVSNV